MDDFYSEMKEILENSQSPVKSELRISTIDVVESNYNGLLAQYAPNLFAEALVPIRARHWPAYIFGSTSQSQMPELSDRIKTPFENLRVAAEYLETSQSDEQWRDRVWQIIDDTTKINIGCETGADVGSFIMGAHANTIADRYMDEMIKTCSSINNVEELNARIFQLEAKEQFNRDVTTVRGTGIAREHVPLYMQGDLCDRPERNARPIPFDDDNNDPLFGDIIIKPNQPNNDPFDFSGSSGNSEYGSSMDSSFESSKHSSESNPDINEDDSIFGRFLGGSSENISSSSDSLYRCDEFENHGFLAKLCDLFIPEYGGNYWCDPTSPTTQFAMSMDMGVNPNEQP